MQKLRGIIVTLAVYHVTGAVERPGPDAGARSGAAHGEQGSEPAPALGDVAAYVPEPPEGARDAQPHLGLAVLDAPVERGANIVVVGLKPLNPACLLAGKHLGLGGLGHLHNPIGVAAPRLLLLSALR